MEAKKTKKADLVNKQGLFFQVGIVVALAIVFASFQWSVEDVGVADLGGVEIQNYEFDMTPVTRAEKLKLKEVKPPKVLESFVITDEPDVEDEEYLIEEFQEDFVVDIIPMTEESVPDEVDVFIIVEEMPEFPGGERALLKFIGQNIDYPEIAKENGVQGMVVVSFVISKLGKVENVAIARGVDPILDREALRVVNLLPNWKAGKQRGKAVNVSFSVPINFKLN